MLKYFAYSLCFFLLVLTLFEFQFQLTLGPIMTAFYFIGILAAAFIVSLVYLIAYRKRHKFFYLPFLLLISGIVYSLASPDLNLDQRLHFQMNKADLESLDQLSKESNIYSMTDMLRYHKRLNDQHIEGETRYSSGKDLMRAFGPYITARHMDPQKLEKIRATLQSANCISLLRSDDLFILTIDGWVDNEYGYVKSSGKKIEVGDNLPPYYFRVVKLIDLGNGWYYFFTT